MKWVQLLFVGALLASACGADDSIGDGPCGSSLGCGGDGGSGGSHAAGSGPIGCDDSSPCLSGHECIDGSCDPYCSDAICKRDRGERAECRGGELGSCRSVSQCGRTVGCLADTDICDTTSDTCYPETGACLSVDDCPFMFEGAMAFGLACQARFCSFPEPPPVRLNDVPESSVIVTVPGVGQSFESAEAFYVQVAGPEALYVAVVTSSLPQGLSDLENAALWVGSMSGAGVLRAADGALIEGESLPRETPLFLTVLRYDVGRLVAASAAVPFALGEGWRQPGRSCADVGTVAGECIHPDRLQACSSRRQCAVVCASNRDCPRLLTSGECDHPDSTGIRFCLPSQ